MHAVSCRIPLVAGVLILLVGCYSNWLEGPDILASAFY
jgi:hypothetical protein